MTVADGDWDAAKDDVAGRSHRSLNRCSSKCARMVHDECSDAAALSQLLDLALSAFDDDECAAVLARHDEMSVVTVLPSLRKNSLSHPFRVDMLEAALADDGGRSSYRFRSRV